MLNNFQIPKFFPFEKTEKTKGVIYQTDLVRPNLPFGVDQMSYFVYEINDSIFISKFRSSKKNEYTKVGDSLLIEYSLDRFEKVKILKNYNNTFNWLPTQKNRLIKSSFQHILKNGYKELKLEENIFTFYHFENNKNINLKVSGTFEQRNDSIILTPLVNFIYDKTKYKRERLEPINDNDFDISKFLIVDKVLVEIDTELIFK